MAAKMYNLRLLQLSKTSNSLSSVAIKASRTAHVPNASVTRRFIPHRALCSSNREETIKTSSSNSLAKPVTTELLSSLKGNHTNGSNEHLQSSNEHLQKFRLEDLQVQWEDEAPIWSTYRRNHKGQIPPAKTRRNCFRGKHVCGNPCPICQLKVKDSYSIKAEDVGLLSQFICPHTGKILDTSKTGVCRQQQKNLITAIKEAQDRGLLPFTVPGPRDPPKRFKEAGIPAPNIRNKK